MTVAELIAELQKYPPHAVVLKESFLGTFYAAMEMPATKIIKVNPTLVKVVNTDRVIYHANNEYGFLAVLII